MDALLDRPVPTLPVIDFFDAAFKADPHWAYAALRRQAPVHQVRYSDGRPVWLVTRHADVRAVLRDPRFAKHPRSVWSEAEMPAQLELPGAMRYLGQHMLASDPPRHTRLRRLVHKAFAPRIVQQLVPRAQAIADGLLAPALPQGRIELIGAYAFPLPITVIAELLGVPAEDQERFRGWSNAIVTHAGARSPEAVAALAPVLEALAAYLRNFFEHKRRDPADDLTTRLIEARDDGDGLSEDELISMLLLLIVAGHETTTHLIGNGLLALLQHPRELARLVADPGLLPQAIDELLRYDGPAETSTLRYAREDLVLGGETLRRGDLVMAVIASANRDAEQFEHPDVLDLTRTDAPNLAFGHGIHFCVGAALARMEAEVAIGTLLRRARGLRLAAPPSSLRWQLGPLMRGLQALPLAFTPTE